MLTSQQRMGTMHAPRGNSYSFKWAAQDEGYGSNNVWHHLRDLHPEHTRGNPVWYRPRECGFSSHMANDNAILLETLEEQFPGIATRPLIGPSQSNETQTLLWMIPRTVWQTLMTIHHGHTISYYSNQLQTNMGEIIMLGWSARVMQMFLLSGQWKWSSGLPVTQLLQVKHFKKEQETQQFSK